MDDWKQVELSNACSRLSSGKNISAKHVTNEGIYPVYGGNGIRGYTDTYNFKSECAIIGRQGAYCGNVRYFSGKAYMTEHAVVICGNKNSNTRFLAYLLSTMQLGRLSGQSAQPGLSVKTLGQQVINLPPLKVQNAITDILAKLDDKIEVNESINKNLEEQSKELFKNWFIDFSPFTSDSNLPENWRIGTVGDIVQLHDAKRIPLSGSERDKMQKIYPYYGATSLMDYVENYLFDGIYLLLGEDGTVVDNLGFPILQYIHGKFWVNNHAHIITGKAGFSVEALYLFFSLTNIKAIVTGAVQQKVSQQNLKKVPAIIPNEDVLRAFDKLIQPIFAQIRNLRDENARLANLRDCLLPKLMSGELNVSDIDL
ncbi:restriction endonuclease subunit S [Phascolarctobacterium sp.]|uniref:restriction endonuclease subunit S n=1 Tax=Phascolarctobacterium sp. TaxID=2049039 RepID=UPI003077578F